MSTQSDAYITDATCQLNGLYIRERSVTLSKEALVEAADAAFSSRTRLDVSLEREDLLINPLVKGSSLSRSTSQYQQTQAQPQQPYHYQQQRNNDQVQSQQHQNQYH